MSDNMDEPEEKIDAAPAKAEQAEPAEVEPQQQKVLVVNVPIGAPFIQVLKVLAANAHPGEVVVGTKKFIGNVVVSFNCDRQEPHFFAVQPDLGNGVVRFLTPMPEDAIDTEMVRDSRDDEVSH